MALPKNKKLTPRSQLLRKSATKEENHLWHDYLKAYPLQFNRQKVIGNFIVDFYCNSVRLALEIDGSQHYTSGALCYDEERTSYLNGLGITVLRFSNTDIKKNFNEVCATIHEKVCELTGSTLIRHG